jgi:altronate dehydratase
VTTALAITPRDNVATALEPIAPGAIVHIADLNVVAVDAIPRGHKLALRPIPCGDHVVKYGSAIGTALCDIVPGAHVHTHNVVSSRGRGDLG